MKVFISWSGDLSRALAVELRDWLPMVVQQVNAWISGRDIAPGQRWALILGHELEQSDFAILCLTRDNLQSPWILFEAGAVARSLEARVVPLLFGITPSDLDGPLAQFQSVLANRLGIENLVETLYETIKSRLNDAQRKKLFTQLYPLLDERLNALSEQAKSASVVESTSDLIAELTESAKRAPLLQINQDTLERLKDEKLRLQRELEYLEEVEEKLTQRDTPISLVERAIEPTQHRLMEVETTLQRTLDSVFDKLTPPQIAILRRLVTPSGIRVVYNSPKLNEADLKTLERMGLIMRQNGLELIHDVVADYVVKRYGAA